MNEDKKFYLSEYISEECRCGGGKKPRYSFCYRCYMALPKDMRNDLYSRMGSGYEEAYDEACGWLETWGN